MLLQKLPLTSPLPLIKHRSNCSFLFHEVKFKTSRTSNYSPLCAVEKESDLELDQDKAREALEKLDQQLQSLSKKQVTKPRKKVITPIVEYDREKQTMMKEDMPDFSDSYFAFSALALLALTIMYNLFFITIIKPSIDGP
ncbi:hypothetical protein AQUCO_01400773v1 [Aquilegia coerulea]|uniref:Transmembrane protein n=1 Tax=Aquilegia coerulea TaxID=218851 RepID=A0A2G5DY12_AQUCA|nr:hypothetical protein AQUCO_01400773v1 [Aquilegia coerulea]